jgi:glycosylphosphatidylinositol transamidase (GPIT) subunit GPI8
MAQRQKNGGFIQLIIIIILSVVILSLLGVSISSLINNKTLRENFDLLMKGVRWLWDNYLFAQVRVMWNSVRAFF